MQEVRRTGLVKRPLDRTWPAEPNELLEAPVIVVSLDMIMELLVLLASGITAAVLFLILELGWRKVRFFFCLNY
jgi:hypothetical protein